MNFVKLIHSEINLQELVDLVSSPTCGATSIFIGHTRDHFNGKKVCKLVYEAYEPMANQGLLKTCADIREKWNVYGIAMYHRLGEVPVKEASVAIAISSEHRAESLQAVQFAIDQLKTHVPIWKKEVYEGDEPAQWKENKECTWAKTDSMDPIESDEMVSYEEDICDNVSPDLIQIKAGANEVKRRIDSFVELKRKQVNMSNVLDFCTNSDSEFSCARVDAVVVRQKDSKGHLRVHRVQNITGPQVQVPTSGNSNLQTVSNVPFVKLEESRSTSAGPMSFGAPQAVEERLRNVEVHLGVANTVSQPVSKDIYARLKILEDRILQLEGLSPEYTQFWSGAPKRDNCEQLKLKPLRKKIFTTAELDKKLSELEEF